MALRYRMEASRRAVTSGEGADCGGGGIWNKNEGWKTQASRFYSTTSHHSSGGRDEGNIKTQDLHMDKTQVMMIQE